MHEHLLPWHAADAELNLPVPGAQLTGDVDLSLQLYQRQEPVQNQED